MNTKNIRLGPGAASLILVLVILTMSVLAMLTLTAARNDETLGNRAIRVAEKISALDERAERTLMAIDAAVKRAAREAESEEEYLELLFDALPENVEADEEEGVLIWTEDDGERYLDCAAELPLYGESTTVSFTRHEYYADMEDTWDSYGFD